MGVWRCTGQRGGGRQGAQARKNKSSTISGFQARASLDEAGHDRNDCPRLRRREQDDDGLRTRQCDFQRAQSEDQRAALECITATAPRDLALPRLQGQRHVARHGGQAREESHAGRPDRWLVGRSWCVLFSRVPSLRCPRWDPRTTSGRTLTGLVAFSRYPRVKSVSPNAAIESLQLVPVGFPD